jgi:hypothetical protein
MEQTKIVEYLIGKYNLDGNSSENIKELQSAANGFQAAMDQITIMQFLMELYVSCSGRMKIRFIPHLGQERYSDTELWIEACKKSPSKY